MWYQMIWEITIEKEILGSSQNWGFHTHWNLTWTHPSSHRKCSLRKGVLRNFAKFTRKNLCQSLFIIKLQASASNFIKKRLTQVFPCEFCEISKNTLFTEHFGATASKQILSHTNTCNKALEKNVSGCRKII